MHDFAKREAARLNVPCNWQLLTVDGIGHDGAAMSRAAAAWWFEGRIPAFAELQSAGFRIENQLVATAVEHMAVAVGSDGLVIVGEAVLEQAPERFPEPPGAQMSSGETLFERDLAVVEFLEAGPMADADHRR
jgi:hypothetical protein